METKDRNDLIQFGLALVNEGLTSGSGGNLSVRSDDSKSFFITPSGMAYDALKKSDLVHMDLEGNLLGGTRKPSSEWHMHAAIYRVRPDIRALIHCHSPYISAFSVLGEDLGPVSYLIASSGAGSVPLAPYETFGTDALAQSAVKALGDDAKAVILANHGLIAGGKTLKEALSLTRDLEFCAFMYMTALSTNKPIQFIPDEKIKEVIEQMKTYGQ